MKNKYTLERANGNGQSACIICGTVNWDSFMYKVKEFNDKRVCFDCKKLLENDYGFLLEYKFDYFVTLVFSPDKVDQFDIDAVIKLFCEFRQDCRRKNPDCKILAIRERHKDGALHFYALISNIDLQLTPALDKDGKVIKDGVDNIVYNVGIWNHGYATATVLPKDDSYNVVVNYILKYLGYNTR